MTSVCVGGVASRVKTGLPTSIYISPVFLASILPPQLEWLRPFIPYIPDLFLDLTTFCAGEPPAQPTLTDATIAAVFAGGDFSAALLAGELIQQALLNWYWYQVCECSSGTQPTAPTPQADPGGLVVVNPPGLVSPSPATPCEQFSGTHAVDSTGSVSVALVGTVGATPVNQQLITAGTTRLDITYTNHASTSTHDEIGFGTAVYNAAGTVIASDGPTTVGAPVHGSNPRLVTLNIPTGARTVFVAITPLFGSPPWTQVGSVDLKFYCGGVTPGQPIAPCCPPDEILNGMVRQILNYVQVIQRQGVPFGYIAGTVHSGLTGQGSITIQGLVGAKADLTTIPASYGRAGTSPTQYFDLGFLTWGTPDGWPTSFRLDHDPTLMFPSRAGLYTQLDYDLAPGVAIAITELKREP